jgi:hypothetical protein
MDASNDPQNSRIDIFARENQERVASMLNRHLCRWEGSEDNWVSWTSSLAADRCFLYDEPLDE